MQRKASLAVYVDIRLAVTELTGYFKVVQCYRACNKFEIKCS